MTRFLRLHPRLLIAALAGIAAFCSLRESAQTLTASLVAWNVGCWSWIVMICVMMSGANSARRHETTGDEDVGAWLVLLFVCLAAFVSIAAVVLELASVPEVPGANVRLHYLLAAATVAGSWLAVGLAFSSHYAHLYFTCDATIPPLRFPEKLEVPQYWDFIYFAFTISVAAQTSDVSVMTTEMRKLVVIQSVLGFVFNAAIIGFSINVFAGAIGKS